MALKLKDYIPALKWGAVLDDLRFSDLGSLSDANGNEIVQFDAVASAVNQIRVANSAASSGPTVSAQGDDTNINLNLSSKGTGDVEIKSDNSARTMARFNAVTSSQNFFQFTTSQAGNAIVFDAVGSDTDITMDINPKGTGTIDIGAADDLTVGGVIVPQAIEVTFHAQAATAMVDQSFFVANQAYEVTAIKEVHAVAEASAGSLKIQVTKDTSTNAPGGGTDLLTNNTNTGFDGKATANTVQTGTLTGTGASLQLAAGDRLSVDFEAAATELVGVTITVTLKRI